MKEKISLAVASTFLLNACSTLDQSFKLGAATGAIAGAAATYAAEGSSGRTPSMENVGVGASIGLGVGLIMSYFIHKEIAADRDESSRQTDVYFGDLPPSPFVIPKSNVKRGGK